MPSVNPNAANVPHSTSFQQPTAFSGQGYNTFDRSRRHATTLRFSQVTPIFVQNTISGDVVKLGQRSQLRNLPVGAPLLSDISMKTTYVRVPERLFMPNTYDVLTRYPKGTSDVPHDAHCYLTPYYFDKMRNALYTSLTNLSGQSGSTQFGAVFRGLALLALIFDEDSLPNRLGYGWHVNDPRIKYSFSEYLYNLVDAAIPSLSSDTSEFCTVAIPDTTGVAPITISKSVALLMTKSEKRELINKVLDGTYDLNSIWCNLDDENFQSVLADVTTAIGQFHINSVDVKQYDLTRILAYQAACAQFFTNDYIDGIDNATKWMSVMKALAIAAFDDSGWSPESKVLAETFTVDGIKYTYDIFSNHILEKLLDYSSNIPKADFNFYRNIFCVNRSLKTGDYFGGARTRALAGADITVEVQSSKVNALDMNKALWLQRLANKVNRSSSDFYNYMKEMFGVMPALRDSLPECLITESQVLGKQETENTTSEDSGAVTTALRMQDSRFLYEIMCDEPSIILGLVSFVSDAPYSMAYDRVVNNITRDDKFNEYLQHLGDTAIEIDELVSTVGARLSRTFGYHSRFSEYKQSISQVSGALTRMGTLKNWIFKDNVPSLINVFLRIPSEVSNLNQALRLNSDFIRNQDSAIDSVLVSASGVGPEYFHFILVADFDCVVNSKQEKNPSLL